MPSSSRTWISRAAPFVLALTINASIPSVAFAQASAATTLIQRGAALYDDQQYEESIQTLTAALLRPGLTTNEKIETYRLLAFNLIILKRNDEADAAVRGIFVLSEDFALPKTESPRFRDFFDAVKKKWIAEGKPGKAPEGKPVVAEKPIKIAHASPAEAKPNNAIKLSGSVEDPDGRVRGLTLAYRTGTKGKFVTVPSTYALGTFRATIPSDAVKPPLVEYYLTAVDKGGLPIISRGDAAAPLRVVVPAPSGSVLTSPFFWVPVGVVVVGGAILTGVLLSRSSSSKTSAVTVNVHE